MSLKIIFINLTIIIFLFIIFEIFSYFSLNDNKNTIKLKEEYIPLLKHSQITQKSLIDHFNNITKLNLNNNGLREYHPNLIYIYKPSLKSETFYTNSLGLLDNEPDNSKKQIMLLGSSVVGGGLRQNFNENIDGFLENHINKNYYENKYEVLNAGIGGYSSTQEFTLMHLLFNELEFKKVIYFSGANDVDTKFRVRNHKDLRTYDVIHSRVIKSQIEDNLLLRKNPVTSLYTYIFNYFIPSLNSYKFLSESFYERKIDKFDSVIKEELNQNDYNLITDIVETYILNVEKMILLSKAKGIDFYVGIQPTIFSKKFKTKEEEKNVSILINKYGYKYKLFYETAYPMMQDGLELLEKKYSNHVTLLDTKDTFNQTKIDIFRDNVHFLEYANNIVSEKIFNSMKFNNN